MRKKLDLRWIESERARKSSFRKRRLGLVKKVSELSTLCDVNASLIIYGPNDQQPTTWPSPQKVQQNLTRFHNMPEIERSKKMMEQDTYLKEKVKKMEERVMKYQRKNKQIEASNLMHIYQGNGSNELNEYDLYSLISFAQEKRAEIKKRVEYLQQCPLSLTSLQFAPSSSAPPTFGQASKPLLDQMAPNIGDNIDTSNHDHNGKTSLDNIDRSNSWEQWFFEMMSNTDNITGSGSVAKTDHMIELNAPCQLFSSNDGNQLGLVDFRNCESHFGNTSGRNQTELMDCGNFSCYSSDSTRVETTMRLQPHEGFKGLINTSGMPMLQSQLPSHIGGNNNINDFTLGLQHDRMSTGITLPPSHFEGNSNGNDIAVSLQPLGNRTNGTEGASGGDVRLPSEFHGGNIAANDFGLPYDVIKQWHNNFHP